MMEVVENVFTLTIRVLTQTAEFFSNCFTFIIFLQFQKMVFYGIFPFFSYYYLLKMNNLVTVQRRDKIPYYRVSTSVIYS